MVDLCAVCLCTGRNLRNILGTKCWHIYSQILHEIQVYQPPNSQLCFECEATLRRLARFKQLVKSSYLVREFVDLDISADGLARPPLLQIQSQPPISISPDLEVHKSETDSLSMEIKVECEHEEPETFVNELHVAPTELNVAPCGPGEDNGGDGGGSESEDEDVADDSKEVKKKDKKKKPKVRKKEKKRQTVKRATKKNKVKSPSVKSENSNEDDSIHDGDIGDVDDVEGETRTESEGKSETAIKEVDDPEQAASVLEKSPRAPAAKRAREVLPERPTCPDCGKVFSSKKTYRYHRNVLHAGHNQHPCARCGKVFQWKSNLGRHMRSHKAADSDELHCALCDKRFASIATFRQHLKVSRRHVPESAFPYECRHCGKRFVSSTRLRDHVDWEHLNHIKFRCNTCNKPFKCHTSLYVHRQNVHRDRETKNNLCHVCGKAYQNPAKLKYHIVAMHTSQTPYRCERCDAAFGWYSSLYRHVREVHHKMKVQQKKPKRAKKLEAPIQTLPPVLPHLAHDMEIPQ